jgi:hypothetical protein
MLDKLRPAQPRHVQVKHREVEGLGGRFDLLHDVTAVARHSHVVAAELEYPRDRFAGAFVVVGDKDAPVALRAGR